jgi:hypothetical protein
MPVQQAGQPRLDLPHRPFVHSFRAIPYHPSHCSWAGVLRVQPDRLMKVLLPGIRMPPLTQPRYGDSLTVALFLPCLNVY